MIRVTIALAPLLVSLVGCKDPKGVQLDPRQLVPADATAAFGFELARLRDSPFGPVLYDAMQGDADMRSMITAATECKIEVADMRGLAATVLDRDDRFLFVIESTDIGSESNIRCLEKEFAKATGKDSGLILFETKGDVRALPQEGGGSLVILNKDMVAVCDEPWEAGMFAAITSPPAIDGTPVGKTIAGLDLGTDAWFSFVLSDSDRAGLGDIEGGDGIQSVMATADLADGIELDLAVQGRDAANAKQLETSIRTLVDQLKPALPDAGLPATLLDGTKITSADTRVITSLAIGKDVLPGVMTTMAPMLAQ